MKNNKLIHSLSGTSTSTAIAIGILPLAILVGCSRLSPSGDVKIETDDQKASYFVGQSIGKRISEDLKNQDFDLDSKVLIAAIGDTLEKKPARVDEKELQEALNRVREKVMTKINAETDKNIKAAEDFLAKNKSEKGVVETASGLQYMIVTEGKGPKPKPTDEIVFHYKGVLEDGTEFDSSYTRGNPVKFPLNQLIPGWIEGIPLMKKGGKAKFFIHPKLGYGRQQKPKIPPGSLLIFDVELVDIVKK